MSGLRISQIGLKDSVDFDTESQDSSVLMERIFKDDNSVASSSQMSVASSKIAATKPHATLRTTKVTSGRGLMSLRGKENVPLHSDRFLDAKTLQKDSDRYANTNDNFEDSEVESESEPRMSTYSPKIQNDFALGQSQSVYSTQQESDSIGQMNFQNSLHGSEMTPQLCDPDVESFNKTLHEMVTNFESRTSREFLRIKRQVLNDQATTIENEKKRCEAMISLKSNEIENLKDQLEKTTKNYDVANQRVEIMALWFATLKTKSHYNQLTLKCFHALKTNQTNSKQAKTLTKIATSHCNSTLKRHTITAWLKRYKTHQHTKQQSQTTQLINHHTSQLREDYENDIFQLKEQIADLSTRLEQETAEKNAMKDNLKKAFMRGVSALNFEAMTILTPDESVGKQQNGGGVDGGNWATPGQGVRQGDFFDSSFATKQLDQMFEGAMGGVDNNRSFDQGSVVSGCGEEMTASQLGNNIGTPGVLRNDAEMDTADVRITSMASNGTRLQSYMTDSTATTRVHVQETEPTMTANSGSLSSANNQWTNGTPVRVVREEAASSSLPYNVATTNSMARSTGIVSNVPTVTNAMTSSSGGRTIRVNAGMAPTTSGITGGSVRKVGIQGHKTQGVTVTRPGSAGGRRIMTKK